MSGADYCIDIYIGSQRIVSKLGDLDSYGQDPRRIEYAGAGVDGAKVDYKAKYQKSQQAIKDNYAAFEVPYYGKDNDDYVNGGGFCCDDTPKLKSFNPSQNDNPELYQFYYHSDHLGSSSLITNLDGEIVQHIEYVPFGEVFIEERNNKWNTPFLFNAKELDEETGLYYYGARYYDPRISVWLSVDALATYDPFEKENFIDGKHNGGVYNSFNLAVYGYCYQNPVKLVDPNGKQSDYNFQNLGAALNIDKATYQAAYNKQNYGYVGESTWNVLRDGMDKLTPAAIVLSVSLKAGAILYGEGKVSLGIILKGNNKGLHGYATGSTGTELDVEVSGGLSVDAVYPERANQFRGSDLEDKSTESFFEVAVKRFLNKAGSINVNLSKGESQSEKAGDIDTYGVGVSAGFSASGAVKGTIGKILDVFNIGSQENHTKGFKTNSYKQNGE